MYKSILTIICITVMGMSLNAQNKDATKTLQKHHVGIHASSLGGVGFSYRYWPGKLGVQITTLPIFRQNKGYFLSIGATALYTLKEGKTVDLYSYIGTHYIGENYSGNQQNNGSSSLNTGLGVGFKINLSEFLNLNIQTGYGFYNITESLSTTIAGGAGLYYSF